MKVHKRKLACTVEQVKSGVLLEGKENIEKRKKILDIFYIGRYTSFIVKGKDVPSYVRGTSLPFLFERMRLIACKTPCCGVCHSRLEQVGAEQRTGPGLRVWTGAEFK